MVVIPLLGAGPASAVRLSPREQEILLLICEGRPVKEIAAELGITPGTTHQTLNRMRRGLGLNSRAELMVWAFQHPAAMRERRAFLDPRRHQPGCPCGEIYCAAMRAAHGEAESSELALPKVA